MYFIDSHLAVDLGYLFIFLIVNEIFQWLS